MVMAIPMIILGVPSIVSGFLGNPINAAWGLGIVEAHWFAHLMGYVDLVHVEPEAFDITIASASTVVALAGIGLAYLMYQARAVKPEAVGSALKPAYVAAYDKYHFDQVYEDWITRRSFYRALAGGTDWFDRNIVDKIVEAIGFLGRNLGRAVGALETGQVQAYGIGISAGVLLIVVGIPDMGLNQAILR